MKTQSTLIVISVLLGMASCKKESVSNQQPSSQKIASSGDEVFKAVSAKYNRIITLLDFSKKVNNPYLPLKPGTIFYYTNKVKEDGEVTKEHITVTVTYDTKNILGVNCRVVHDQVKVDDKITEDTYDWYTQDRFGNVWYFGEDTKSFDKHGVDSSGSFEAGVDGALPGIVMFAQPEKFIGVTYYQEFFPGEAVDQAMVAGLDGTANVAYGNFENCLVTKEFTALEPGVVERKFYSYGTGQVLTILNKGGEEREELTGISQY